VRGQACRGFCWGHLRETDHLEDSGVDWRIILRRILRSGIGGAWTGLICLRRGTGGEHL